MAGEQFGRVVALEFGQPGTLGQRIDGLRIRFRVRRSRTGSPDAAEVAVWNASPEALASLGDPGVVVRVLPGYGTASQVVGGSLVRKSLRVEDDGVDRVAVFQIADGGLALRSVRVSQGWASAVKASELVEYLRAAAAWSRGTIRLGTDVEYTTGEVLIGSVGPELDRIVRDCGSQWSVQNGALQVWPLGESRPRETGPLLSPTSGLLGSPRTVDGGIEVRCLLLPGMLPGMPYRVASRDVEGDFIATDVEHDGDSGFGNEFQTTIVGVPRG